MQTKEYIMHLLAEMSNYILEAKPNRMVISLHQEDDGLHLCVLDSVMRPEEELEAMRKALTPPYGRSWPTITGLWPGATSWGRRGST